ncbi:glycosyltransferase family 39 protein [bacterium]|nr:glycosyltransferase family 39 protein [bacterium]
MATGTKLSESTIQSAVWQIELGRGRIVVYWVLLVLLALCLGLVYTASEFRGLEKREAMDLAQVARNLARGDGFSTQVIRPLSVWQLQKVRPDRDAQIFQHPDLVNPPAYVWSLSRLFRLLPASVFEFQARERLYAPERWVILPFNQLCLLLSLLVIYLWARQLFDRRVAITAGLLLLFSDTLWKHGVSGLPTPFLMLWLLLALYGLYALDRRLHFVADGTGEPTPPRPVDGAGWGLLIGSAVLLGVCFLTRYMTAWLLLPVLGYVVFIGRGRRGWLWAVIYLAVFIVVITPWLVRNEQVSGSLLGLARFAPVEFGSDKLARTLDPTGEGQLSSLLNVRALGANILVNLRRGVFEKLPLLGTAFLTPLFLVGLLYGFRRREVMRLRGALVGVLAAAIVGMAITGVRPERSGPDVYGDDLLVLVYPLLAVFGVAFFYLLLDRIGFRIRLTRALAVGGFALLNVAPLVFTLFPPRRSYLPYPPYAPPVTRAVAGLFDKEEIGCSDLPWSMAWTGDRRTVQLPLNVEQFYTLHDFVLPHGFSFLMLTPYMLNRPLQSELFRGEYEGWSSVVRGKLPSRFPLRSTTWLPPGRDQYLFADRERWKETVIEEPDPVERERQAAEAVAAAAGEEETPAAPDAAP